MLLDPIKAKVITSKGEQHWGGAASTMFWLGPEKEIVPPEGIGIAKNVFIQPNPT